MKNNIPLFVDLDGTIIKEDIGQMALKEKIIKNYFSLIIIVLKFIFLGKPATKFYISKNYKVDNKKLTFNSQCLEFIQLEKEKKRKIYLISGSHQLLVDQFREYLHYFDGFFGTCDNYNMISYNKVKFIKKNLNISKFDYIGNSNQDMAVWQNSENVIYTNVSSKIKKKIQRLNKNKINIKSNFY